MTRQEVIDLELNDKVRYGFFNNLIFKGRDDRHVILEDRSGYQKKIYIDLFRKHGAILEKSNE